MKNIGGIKATTLLITLFLTTVAANTALQLWLQKDIASKSEALEHQLKSSAAKSTTMNEQLTVVAELKEKTGELDKKVKTVESNTNGLGRELNDLDTVVASIADRVHAISGNTKQTEEDLKKIRTTLHSSTNVLKSVESSNKSIVSTLNGMERIQRVINTNLKEINQKTRFIPQSR
ncbi:hypothetical protein [Salinithrix halophila]|uniref:Chromosome partition protein Smc n=1 Tax=Salinithrix halophila TaxID=1485204 RepID=A0ABV8JH66_9BACL